MNSVVWGVFHSSGLWWWLLKLFWVSKQVLLWEGWKKEFLKVRQFSVPKLKLTWLSASDQRAKSNPCVYNFWRIFVPGLRIGNHLNSKHTLGKHIVNLCFTALEVSGGGQGRSFHLLIPLSLSVPGVTCVTFFTGLVWKPIFENGVKSPHEKLVQK